MRSISCAQTAVPQCENDLFFINFCVFYSLIPIIRRKNLKRAIGAACIGGGQGIAVLIESV